MAARILVVDDEEDYRIIARDVLQAEGYEVGLASDGEEGLAAVREQHGWLWEEMTRHPRVASLIDELALWGF